MLFFRKLSKIIPILSILSLLFVQLTPLQAAVVGNNELLAQAQHQVTVSQVLATLERDDVKNKLISLGVDPADAKHRISQMNDQELAQMTQNMDQMPAGSGVFGLIAVIFIVLVVTDMLGATDVFSFVHDINHH